MTPLTIAIDGPAASGKGTIARGLARHFHLPHLDTGLLYRAVGLAARDLTEEQFERGAITIAEHLDISNLDESVLALPHVAQLAARVARIEGVRAALRQSQIDFANQPAGAVLDGRDIGTRIMPNARVKLYVTAAADVRARRRTDQMLARGEPVTYEEILAQIEARDKSDRDNPAGAFFVADDAHLLETSQLDIEAALRAAIAIVDQAVDQPQGD